MTGAFVVIIIAGVTLALLGASVWLARRGRDGTPIVDENAYARPQAAPWEREDAQDLTAPVSTELPPTVAEPPAGARFRAAKADIANGRIVEEVERGLAKIPPLPRALQQILRELNNAGSTTKSVASIVATEQVLSAALLRVVNSAASGMRRDVITVDQAVTYLGFSTVRALVVRLQMGGLLASNGAGSAAAGGAYDAEKLWMHSVATSQLAEHLAGRVTGVDPWLASTIGLLHDIGKLAVNSQFPEQVKQLWAPNAAPAGESFLARERRLFGADHAFIGAYLTARWELPSELVEAIRLHHLPTEESNDGLRPDVLRASCVVHVANQLVKFHHVYCEDMEIDIIRPEMLAAMGFPQSLEDLLDERVKTVIDRATRIGAAAAPDPSNRPLARVA
jgi:putative nucleotidyltransferase with HDIG domain